MTWLDLLGQVAGLGGIESAARSYLRGQVITQAVRAGASANSILSALSANGLGIRRQQGLDLVANEADRQRSASPIGQVPYDATPESVIGAAPENWTGNYVHQVTATYRERDEEGNYTIYTRTMGIKGANLLTPEEAGMAALDIMSTQAPGEASEGNYPTAGQVLTVGLTGTWYDTQGRNLPGY